MSRPSIILEEGHQRLIRARHGYVLYNRNDTVIGCLIENYGEYFESEVDVFRRFVTSGDIVLDVGANIGTHTLALARIVGPRGFAYAFEPQRIVFQTLCANMALNSVDNVHCVNAAVDETGGWITVSDPDPGTRNNFGGAQVDMLAGAANAPPIPRLVLDEFLDTDHLKLIKIDVEGMEASVLRGARRQIARFRPVLYVENAFPDKSPELLSLLSELGYQCYWHLPVYLSGQNFFGTEQRLFPVGFVDHGQAHLDCIGIAVNLLCLHAASGASVHGLRPVADFAEHPLKREYVHLFASRDGSAGFPFIHSTG